MPNVEEKATKGDGSSTSLPHRSNKFASENKSTTTPNDENFEHHALERETSNVYKNSALRRSIRTSTLPKRFDNFVLNDKVKFNLDKVVNYSKLSVENDSFVSNVNKSLEPRSYSEVAVDNK